MQIFLRTLLISCLMAYAGIIFGQQKYEQESRIDQESVPDLATVFINGLGWDISEKWYQETRLTDYSYECKFKWDSHRYSIEFDSLGTLEDAEIEWKKSEVPPQSLAKMQAHFMEKFRKSRVRKIQIQYSGKPALVQQWLKTNQGIDRVVVRYEVVVKGWNKDGPNWYEMTFAKDGTWIKTDEIIATNVDHLVY